MPLRRIEITVLAASISLGAALPPGTISGDTRTLLVTFVGIISASILPTVTLLVNAMTAGGRSVHSINQLETEMQAAMDALFFILGCALVTLLGLVLLSVKVPEFLGNLPRPNVGLVPRASQAILLAGASMVILRAGQIPAILRRSLSIRHEIALDEARRKVNDKVPSSDELRRSFANHPDFGKIVPLPNSQLRE
ncbi:hypothetical protein NRP21_01195 [Roseomonas pecuniae]|uniref:Uncharacterized protein n=1 Tax=Roseomonas populi TaxID=3121582 RepID=A0ABT1WXU6_9PROT|nr:hypothetical protein [Roseomonas pecuniae]